MYFIKETMKICGRIFEITNEEIVSVNNNMTNDDIN